MRSRDVAVEQIYCANWKLHSSASMSPRTVSRWRAPRRRPSDVVDGSTAMSPG